MSLISALGSLFSPSNLISSLSATRATEAVAATSARVPQPVPAPTGVDAFVAFVEDVGTRGSEIIPLPSPELILRPSGLLGAGGLLDDLLSSLDYLAAVPVLGFITSDVLRLSGRHDSLNHQLSNLLAPLGDIYYLGRPLGGGDAGYLGSVLDFIPDNLAGTPYVPAPAEKPLTDPARKYSVILLPDTQYYTNGPLAVMPLGSPDMVKLQTQWIADHIDSENIVFVSQLGDVADSARSVKQYQIADEAMSILDGKVAYSVLPGNHDFYAQSQVSVTDTDPLQAFSPNYLEFFGQDRFRAQDAEWYGGTSPNGMSSYQFIQMGDKTFLHIALEKKNLKMSLPWAQQVIDTYKGMPTIISTHANITDEGDGISITDYGPDIGGRDLENGQFLFDYLVKDNPQVFMINNGHYSRIGAGQDNAGEITRTGINSAGQPVIEVLSDYQFRPYGGDGYFRQIEFEFRDGNDIIAYRTLSAVPGNPEEMDENSRFAFENIDFDDPTRFTSFARPDSRTLVLGDAEVVELSSNGAATLTDGATVFRDPAANSESQVLLRFGEIDRLPADARILSAVLVFETTDGGDGAHLYRMAQGWGAGATWAGFGGDGVQPGDEAVAVAPDWRYFDGQAAVDQGVIPVTDDSPYVGDYPYGFLVDWDGTAAPGRTVGNKVYVDVTQSVRAWVEGGEGNNGWVLTAPQSSGQWGMERYHLDGEDAWGFAATGDGAPRLLIDYVGGDTEPEIAVPATDLTGDGKAEIVWTGSGNKIQLWSEADGKVAKTAVSDGGKGTPTPLAFGDIDGDGLADLLFRDGTGKVSVRTGETGGSFAAARNLGNASGLQALALADIDGDGTENILWRGADGTVHAWQDKGSGDAASASLSKQAPAGWQIVGVGDFDGDGTDDLLWQDKANSSHHLWRMNGRTVVSDTAVEALGAGQTVLATGDFNGDGMADIVAGKADGSFSVVLLDRGTAVASADYASRGAKWRIVGVDDYSGDGRDDLLWHNAINAQVDTWTMAGTERQLTTQLGTQFADWTTRGALMA
ncbi:FG-GAP-like repeat-containing protein [Zavarzinia compransoris]|uniref:Calcineurin-like phosphoesterase domain-containing protein n=1 Tax=Zavarzinia compransoris TaxID=1264899 RepID=A0A317DXD9_9PROT|nr:FG-GAP-like repeat-containing protein [Zavarzinia compransoris]PWR17613.1 hypothetical protein DKG75_22310 [Zavarzinia compransoris]TDP44108.1 VCBS repeat protein [Zavarzinia compransoris]